MTSLPSRLTPQMAKSIALEIRRSRAGKVRIGCNAQRRLMRAFNPHKVEFLRALSDELSSNADFTVTMIVSRNPKYTDAHLPADQDRLTIRYDLRTDRWSSDTAAGVGFDPLCTHVWRIRGRLDADGDHDLFALYGAGLLAYLDRGNGE